MYQPQTSYEAWLISDIRREKIEQRKAGKREFGPGFRGTYYYSYCPGNGRGRWVSGSESICSPYCERTESLEVLKAFARKHYGQGTLKATEVTTGMDWSRRDQIGMGDDPYFLRGEVDRRNGQRVSIVRAYAIVAVDVN